MKRAGPRNVSASVLARLLALSKKSGDDYNVLLTAYVFERFLFRLGISEVRDRFVLKGAMLLRVWSDHPYRSTRDLDLLRRGDASDAAIREDIVVVCSTPVDADGLLFDTDSMELAPIRPDEKYAGTRVTMTAYCGNARIPMQIDVGVGDAVYPRPVLTEYATLLEMPAPRVVAYAAETVIAEKVEAMVVLGMRNSRIRDFFDVWYLAQNFPFERQMLTRAIAETFKRRGTPIPEDDPIALTPEYWRDPAREPHIRAFVRRARLEATPERGVELLDVLRPFLIPLLDDVRRGVKEEGTWLPGGPWS